MNDRERRTPEPRIAPLEPPMAHPEHAPRIPQPDLILVPSLLPTLAGLLPSVGEPEGERTFFRGDEGTGGLEEAVHD